MVRGNKPVTSTSDVDVAPESVVTAELVEGNTAPGTPGHHVRILRDDLDAITSFDDALELLAAHGVTPVDAAEILADEFGAISKDSLINVPFVVLDTKTSWGDFGPFVTVRIITKDNVKLRFSDGSSGIYNQLIMLREKYGIQNAVGMRCMKGLTKSTYTRRDGIGEPILNEKGMEEKGTTYYFNTEKAVPQIGS